MRPAMRFRGEIETGRVPGLLLVPREAVFLRDDGPVVWVGRRARLARGEVEARPRQPDAGRGALGAARGRPREPRGPARGSRRPRARRLVRPALAGGSGGRAALRRRSGGGARPLGRRAARALGRAGPGRDLRGRPGRVRARGRGARHAEGGEGDADRGAAGVGPAAEGRRRSCKDGARLKAGDTIVEFDPYDAQQGGGRRAGRPQAAARARSTRPAPRARRTSARSPSTRTSPGRTRAREDVHAHRRAALLPARRSSSRGSTASSPRPRWTCRGRARGERRSSRRRIARSARSTRARRSSSSRSPRRACARCGSLAPHDGLVVLERNWRGETTFVGDTLWPGQKIAELPDLSQLEAKVFVLEADGAGLKPGLVGAPRRSRAGPARSTRRRCRRSSRSPRPRDWQSPVQYFETTLSLATTDPRS